MIRDRRRRGVLGQQGVKSIGITESLRQFIPDDHVLVHVDRVLDLSRCTVSWGYCDPMARMAGCDSTRNPYFTLQTAFLLG
jgi:hypothetical protein